MATVRAQIAALPLRNFAGGLNLRDVWAELGAGESPLAYNVIYDERGAVVARLGISSLNGSSLLPQVPCYLYYSEVADALLAYISTDVGAGKLYKSTDGGVNWSAAYSTFTAGATGAIVDFNNQVIVVNTLDGVYAFPSNLGAPTHTSGGTNNMDEARGSCIAAWKNRVVVAGDPRNDSSHSTARVWASAIGDALTWNDATVGSWSNDLREVDDQPITAICAGQGVDINQKPTLLVCKRNSTYRINDSETGAYTTLHSSGAGAASPTAYASLLGRIVTINDLGVWVTDGIAVPIRVSGKIAPLFKFDLNLDTMSGWAGGVQGDRAVFNVARRGSSTNNFQLEYYPLLGIPGAPEEGTFGVHKGMSLGPMTVYTKSQRKLIAASSSTGKVYQVGVGGTDDGTDISTFWTSKDFPLLGGREARIRDIRVWGRGDFNIAIRTDYQRSTSDEYPLAYAAGGFVWDVDHWDQSTWGDVVYVSDEAQPLDLVGRNAQIAVSATVSSSSTAPALLDDGTAPETGAWGFYEALLRFIPLGFE